MRHSITSLSILVALAMNCGTVAPGFCQEPSSLEAPDRPNKVLFDGQWTTPEDVAARNAKNDVLNKYVSLRGKTADNFEGQTQLATWCDSNRLIEQRNAHLQRALTFNPESVEVRNLLGHVNVNGAWYSAEQVSSERKLAMESARRMTDFQKSVTEIGSYLLSESKKRQQIGLDRLSEIDDPRSVTALEQILIPSSEAVAHKTLDVIEKFVEREVTESLMRISIFSAWESVRVRAQGLLAERNRYDYVPALMNQLLSPFSIRKSIASDGRGNVLYQYALHQKDMNTDAVRQFDAVMLQNPMSDRDLRPDLRLDATVRSLQADAMVMQANNQIATKNRAIQTVLASATGVEPGDEPDDWWRWWYDENEVTLYERPVRYSRVVNTEMSVPYMRAPRNPGQNMVTTTRGSHGECLVAGSLIWTERGPLPVETLMIGDRVLSQDVETKKLEYRVVLQPTVRPPTATFQMWLAGEVVQASGGHLFWVDQEGWKKVRDLEAGMSLIAAGGAPVSIEKIVPAETVQLYNLIVECNANYFVGSNRVLSHDSTILAQGEKSVEQTAKE